jgi:hypothetical protein
MKCPKCRATLSYVFFVWVCQKGCGQFTDRELVDE